MIKKILIISFVCLLILIGINLIKSYSWDKKLKVPKMMNEYMKQGLYDQAIELGEKEIEKKINNYVIYAALGSAYSCKKEYDKALKYYNISVKLNKKSFDTYLGIAICYIEKKMGQEAIETLEYIISQKPKDKILKNKAYDMLIGEYVGIKEFRKTAIIGLKRQGIENPSENLINELTVKIEKEYGRK